MERVEERTITSTREIHKFYCDGCGKPLGESMAYDDGWFYPWGDYNRKYYDPKEGWLELNGNYCDECTCSMDEKIRNALKELGFKKDVDDES